MWKFPRISLYDHGIKWLLLTFHKSFLRCTYELPIFVWCVFSRVSFRQSFPTPSKSRKLSDLSASCFRSHWGYVDASGFQICLKGQQKWLFVQNLVLNWFICDMVRKLKAIPNKNEVENRFRLSGRRINPNLNLGYFENQKVFPIWNRPTGLFLAILQQFLQKSGLYKLLMDTYNNTIVFRKHVVFCYVFKCKQLKWARSHLK